MDRTQSSNIVNSYSKTVNLSSDVTGYDMKKLKGDSEMNIFVPGRICLFGEHTDWAGSYRRINGKLKKGYAIIVGTNQGIYARIKPHPDKLVITSTLDSGEKTEPVELPMDIVSLEKEARSGSFLSYIAGVAYQVLTHYKVGGVVIDNYCTDLPLKKGLSSSAAICVLVTRAFNRLYDLKMTIRGEMEFAYRGEITTYSRCGRMDQGCAYGNHPIMMTFDGDQLDIQELRVSKDLYYVIVDLKGQKDTIKILTKLNQCYPFPDNPVQEGVQQFLGPICESITTNAAEVLQNGDAVELGQLMNHAQQLFDQYCIPVCPEELEAPLLHKLLSCEPLKPFLLGGKGVGSQGDGSAQLLVRDEQAQEKVISIISSQLGMNCLKLTIQSTQRIRKAIIPAAGFGTRLFPATKVVKKELFPVMDHTSRVKPVILLIVEEILSAGLEEVGIIVQPGDKEIFEDFFHNPIDIEHYNKLSVRDQKYLESLHAIGEKVTLLLQEEQMGFGHAIYCAREWLGRDPFLINLGDHLFTAYEKRSCTRQLLDVYDKIGLSVVGLKPEPVENISNFGCVTGKWSEELGAGILDVSEFVEKPTIDYARERLVLDNLSQDHYLTLSGQYILTPLVFQYLEEHIKNNFLERSEYQLTSCLEKVRKEEGFYGYVINGKRFDIGQPELYRQTMIDFPDK